MKGNDMANWVFKIFSVLVVNCMSVSTGPAHAASIMRRAIRLRATIILATECRDFLAREVDDLGLYYWFQVGRKGSEESGVLVGVLKTEGLMKRGRLLRGSPRTREGDGIGARFIPKVKVHLYNGMKFFVSPGHAPPNRAPIARALYMARWALVRAKIKGGDTNLRKVDASAAFKSRVIGSGVLYATIPLDCKVIDHGSVDLGGDHMGELITYQKKRNRFRGKKAA